MAARFSLTSPGARRLVVALSMAFVVVALDQITKAWAVSRLTEGTCTPESCVDVFWTIRFHLHFNRGASFSTGEGFGRWFGVLALVMSMVLLRQAARSHTMGVTLLFGALSGGAIGNLIDRLFRADDGFLSGGVVDFIDLQWWPIFNIADAAIVLGVISLVVSGLRSETHLPVPQPTEPSNP